VKPPQPSTNQPSPTQPNPTRPDSIAAYKGSAHCVLAPFFAARLGKTEMVARQCSPRGGDVYVRLAEPPPPPLAPASAPAGAAGGQQQQQQRVFVSGEGVTAIRGTMLLPPLSS